MSAPNSVLVIALCFLVIFLCQYRTVYDYLFTPQVLLVFWISYGAVAYVVGSLELKIGSRLWLYRKIYSYLSIPLAATVHLISVLKQYGSRLPEDTSVSRATVLICALITMLAMAAYLAFALNFEYQLFLSRRKRDQWMSRYDDLLYRSVGRFRVREDDDDFKCFTTD